MKIKTNELTGAALDWAVAKALGYEVQITEDDGMYFYDPATNTSHGFWIQGACRFSSDWAEGGPIIEREKINVVKQPLKDVWHGSIWKQGRGWTRGAGPTPLIAAMRCYVASKLGEEVEIPEELV